MSALVPFLRLMWQEQRRALLRALLLSLLVLLAGIGLLGLSGWFITAAGIAGLAGVGAVFDVFRPGAGVRALALGRTAARYGERLLTHDATLRVLAGWRVQLLSALARAPYAVQSRLRGGSVLNRITSDVDALDGLSIRLVFPLLAGFFSLLAACAMLWWLVLPAVAIWLFLVTCTGVAAAGFAAGRAASGQAALAEDSRQALRAGIIDHLRSRVMLAVDGRLPASRGKVLKHDARARHAALRLAGIEIALDAAMQALSTLSAAGALLIAGQAVLAGQIGPAQAALAFFAALAMAELVAPLSRAITEYGRMRQAAVRLEPMMLEPVTDFAFRPMSSVPQGGLVLTGLSVGRGALPVLPPFDLRVAPGETIALTGRSGLGKTTLLDTVAGLLAPLGGQIAMADGVPDEAALRKIVGYQTQRPALTSGTIAEVLRLANAEASDDDLRQVLAAVALPLPLARWLGEAGQGLSGGEARRLSLARVLLRRPAVLLLDEPTEGLDPKTARQVLSGIREYLPDAAVLIASHRRAERQAADRIVDL